MEKTPADREREIHEAQVEDRCPTCGLFSCACYDDGDDGWSCTHCGGDGYCEVDDPLWDDCDQFGIGDCSACGGTGERKHQTVF